jgi:charged multivesicular body protein 7
MLMFVVVLLLPAVLVRAGQNWDGLRVTWDLNPFSSNAFAPLPRDLNNDNMNGFVLMDDQCSKPNGPFKGRRFWKDSDPAVITIYDKNGYIAGIQTSMPKSQWSPSSPMNGHPVVDDGNYWTLTAYTVDPSTICSTGRTADQYNTQGTGYGLWIQNGTNPVANSLKIPLDEASIKQTPWLFGHCFYTMGDHYWYNPSADMQCDNFFPYFLLYNKGVLNAFGFAVNGNFQSPRYEHPATSVIGQFMNPVPNCFSTDPRYTSRSTMHVYFTDWPRTTCLC